jgi:hypothetical protein
VGEIERKAQQFLIERLGENIDIPVDVEFLLESIPGVDLDCHRGLREQHNIDGMVMRNVEMGTLLVLIDEYLMDRQGNRYRMTVAEELGHIVLHRELIEQIRGIQDIQELHHHKNMPLMERNAKRFAAAILMPG